MRKPRSPAPQKPADAASGAAHVRKFMVKLFDREDGKAADWPLIAETLLREAFYALDQSPDDPRVLSLLRRVSSGSYDRLSGYWPESIQPLGRAQNEGSNAAENKTPALTGRNEAAQADLQSPGPGTADAFRNSV